MDELTRLFTQLLLDGTDKILSKVSNDKLRAICESYADQIVPEVASQLVNGRLELKELPMQMPRDVKGELNKLALQTAFTVIDKVAERLPEGEAKEELHADFKHIVGTGITTFIDEGDWQNAIVGELKQYGVDYAKTVSQAAFDKVRTVLPDNQYTAAICNDADELAAEIIDSIAEGRSMDDIYSMAEYHIRQEIKTKALNYAKEKTDASIDYAIKQLAAKAKQKGRSKAKKRYNKQVDAYANHLRDSLKNNVGSAVIDVVNGDKDIVEAAKDIAVNSAKDSAYNYLEQNGAELAKEAIETITEKVANKIGNKATKEMVLKTGAKLANVNTVAAIAEGVYDLGRSFKDFLDGKISKAELLRQIGEKGSEACLSSLGATYGGGIGFVVGGPAGAAIGAAIGSMVGFIASSMLYGSVLQAFENEEAARIHAEQTHAFCEMAIRRMQSERAEFERQSELLFKERQIAAIEGFRTMEQAVLNNDFDKFSAGLNRIANSFGQKLQFTNFKEFDAFMESDEDFEL